MRDMYYPVRLPCQVQPCSGCNPGVPTSLASSSSSRVSADIAEAGPLSHRPRCTRSRYLISIKKTGSERVRGAHVSRVFSFSYGPWLAPAGCRGRPHLDRLSGPMMSAARVRVLATLICCSAGQSVLLEFSQWVRHEGCTG